MSSCFFILGRRKDHILLRYHYSVIFEHAMKCEVVQYDDGISLHCPSINQQTAWLKWCKIHKTVLLLTVAPSSKNSWGTILKSSSYLTVIIFNCFMTLFKVFVLFINRLFIWGKPDVFCNILTTSERFVSFFT